MAIYVDPQGTAYTQQPWPASDPVTGDATDTLRRQGQSGGAPVFPSDLDSPRDSPRWWIDVKGKFSSVRGAVTETKEEWRARKVTELGINQEDINAFGGDIDACINYMDQQDKDIKARVGSYAKYGKALNEKNAVKEQTALMEARLQQVKKPFRALGGNLEDFRRSRIADTKQMKVYDSPALRTITTPSTAKGQTLKGLEIVRQEIAPQRHDVISASRAPQAMQALHKKEGLVRVKEVTLPSAELRQVAAPSAESRKYNASFTRYPSNLSPIRQAGSPKLASLQGSTQLSRMGSSPLSRKMVPTRTNLPTQPSTMPRLAIGSPALLSAGSLSTRIGNLTTGKTPKRSPSPPFYYKKNLNKARRFYK